MNSEYFCTEEELSKIIECSPPEIKRTMRMFIRKNEKSMPKQKRALLLMFKQFLKTSNFEVYSKKLISLALCCSKSLIKKVWKMETEELVLIKKKPDILHI